MNSGNINPCTFNCRDTYATQTAERTSNSEQETPPRFIKIDGVMQLNPAFRKFREMQNKVNITDCSAGNSMPVVSNLGQYEEWNAASKNSGYGEIPLSESTQTSFTTINKPETYQKVGLSPSAIINDLGQIFAKHEAPIGLLSKLLAFTEYDELQFIIDDSGSMNEYSDTKDNCGRFQTRWEEAHSRIKEMLEILAYVPTPKLTICFFNRKNIIELQRKGEPPEVFLQNICYQLDAAFKQYPQGSTPAKECLDNSFRKYQGKKVARYFFCDGEPDGGESAKKTIACMVKNRHDPKGNPLTFLSCTNKDSEVEWMKQLEEEAPFCAEYDDFEDEAREVRCDQGKNLPFTKGFHLIGQLVGAMNPEDLDAMDESIPFTKRTLDNLLGVQTSIEEYRNYYNGFKEAQQSRNIENNKDIIKARYDWEPYFLDFVRQHSVNNIEGVKSFQRMI